MQSVVQQATQAVAIVKRYARRLSMRAGVCRRDPPRVHRTCPLETNDEGIVRSWLALTGCLRRGRRSRRAASACRTGLYYLRRVEFAYDTARTERLCERLAAGTWSSRGRTVTVAISRCCDRPRTALCRLEQTGHRADRDGSPHTALARRQSSRSSA